MKTIAENKQSYEGVRRGIDRVFRLVSSTLGPKGRNSILDKGYSSPKITNDGVSIARDIEVEDDIERMGVELMKDVATRTNEEAGDGTTTSIVLAHSIVEECEKYSENPMIIRESLEKETEKVVNLLKKMGKPIKKDKELLQLAIVSSESEQVGNLIAQTFKAIGPKGVITVEQSKIPEIESKIVEGYEIEKGFASPFFATNKDMNKAEHENVKVLVIGENIDNLPELAAYLEKIIGKGIKQLVIFCTEADSAIVNTLIANKQNGFFKSLVVKVASQKNEILQDVCLLTGAEMISREAGKDLSKVDEKVLGYANKIISTVSKTIVIASSILVKNKVRLLEKELKTCKNDNEYDLIEKRIARLSGGVAIISVGAPMEADSKYLYDKVEDAVNAVKSALEEGIVPGGGMTLYNIAKGLSEDTIGEKILKEALKAPLKKIIDNAGRDYTDIIIGMPKGKGYNAKNNTYVDMLKVGIIDPLKVERCSIENAVSFAKTFITSGSTIAVCRKNDYK